jgi:hypothetical protein
MQMMRQSRKSSDVYELLKLSSTALLEWWKKCANHDGEFVQKYMQCTDLTDMLCFTICPFTLLKN